MRRARPPTASRARLGRARDVGTRVFWPEVGSDFELVGGVSMRKTRASDVPASSDSDRGDLHHRGRKATNAQGCARNYGQLRTAWTSLLPALARARSLEPGLNLSRENSTCMAAS